MKSVTILLTATLSFVALLASGHSQHADSPKRAENSPPSSLSPPITEKWSLDSVSNLKDWGSIMFTFKRGEALYSVIAKHRKAQKQEVQVYFDSAENPSMKVVESDSAAEAELLKFLHSVCIHDPKALKDPWLNWLISVISDREFPWKGGVEASDEVKTRTWLIANVRLCDGSGMLEEGHLEFVELSPSVKSKQLGMVFDTLKPALIKENKYSFLGSSDKTGYFLLFNDKTKITYVVYTSFPQEFSCAIEAKELPLPIPNSKSRVFQLGDYKQVKLPHEFHIELERLESPHIIGPGIRPPAKR